MTFGPRVYLSPLRWIGAFIIVVQSAFTLGFYEGNLRLFPPRLQQVELTNNNNSSTERAKIIASGDRGLLFFNIDAGQAEFQKWENVRSIRTLP
jgi:hypothetical protein